MSSTSHTISVSSSRAADVALWVCVVVFNTLNQVSLKFASAIMKDYSFGIAWFSAAYGNIYLWISLVSEVIGFFAWLSILKRHDLSAAFPVSSLAYLAIIASGWMIFHEPMKLIQCLGMIFILAGILMMGYFTASGSSYEKN